MRDESRPPKDTEQLTSALKQYADALEQYEDALELYEELFGDDEVEEVAPDGQGS